MAHRVFRLQESAAATGDGTSANVIGFNTVGFQVTGTFTATITFEGSVDGSNWVALESTKQDDDSRVTTATAPGIFYTTVAHLPSVRARISAYTDGSVTVICHAADGVTCFK